MRPKLTRIRNASMSTRSMASKSEVPLIAWIDRALEAGISYSEYLGLVADQAARGLTSGPEQSDSRIHYTLLNDRRMQRWDRKLELPGEVQDRLGSLSERRIWLVLTESWCGDAAPSLPVMAAFEAASPMLELWVAFRDEHPELIREFPTDGAIAIPKLLVVHPESGEVLGSWGPRPEEPMQHARAYKARHGKLSPEFREDLQKWYNRDKGDAIIRELEPLIYL